MTANSPRLILASQSPRRRTLLEHIGFNFEVIPSDVDEESITAANPRALAVKLAYMKAATVADQAEPPALILAADTVVAMGNEVFGKPVDWADAARMLRALRGKTHQVITGVAVAVAGGRCEVDATSTDVTMRDFSDDEIEAYIATGEPMDKAGAYAIQERGGTLVASHDGCWCNVVGLPLINALRLMGDEIDASAHPVPCTCETWPHHRSGPMPWEK